MGRGFGGGRSRIPIRLPVGRAGRAGGIGGIGLVIVVVAMLVLGVDPSILLNGSGGPGSGLGPAPQSTLDRATEDELAAFVSVVLADTEDTWHAQFESLGETYVEPTLVLFSGAVQSACGYAGSASGPFYCPGDQRIYVDLTFFDALARRFDAPGDFAQAYVIAHEVGHHVQTLLGISGQVRQAQSRTGEAQANALQVRMELQADCLAGLWAHHADRTRGILEPGDIEEALGAANAIGDDTLQRRTQGTIVPDSFTHGTSAQRAEWFRRGFETGSLDACDTFSARQL